MPADESTWKGIAHRKQAQRLSRIPKQWLLSAPPQPGTTNFLSVPHTCGILTAEELRITSNYDAVSLAAAIRSRQLTAEVVTIAFCKRAAIAQQVCNCLTEIFFEDAIERARYLDDVYSQTGRVVGPLHGVPVSLKDSFKVKGYDACIGIVALAENPATENSVLVDILLEQGAILYCKTNVPQGMLSLDSDNNVFGRTLNPRNTRLTAGGSSGGEGALIAMRGSILGVGTDVGGSIRIPAMCNGIYGIKPSVSRVPYAGQESGGRYSERAIGTAASAGPLATSIRDCEFLLKVISDARPWERDPYVTYGCWEDQGSIARKPLFAVLRTDDFVTLHPPVANVINEAVGALRAAGFEVVEICTNLKEGYGVFNAFSGIDGANGIHDLLEKTGESWSPWLAALMKRKQPFDINALINVHERKNKYETEMLKLWKDPSTGRLIDAIICPVAPHPVPPIDTWPGLSYTASFVMLDCPCGTLPVRDITEDDLKSEMSDKPLNKWDAMNRKLWDETKINRRMYLESKLSIQVVAPRMQERKLYQAMALIDKLIHGVETEKARL